MSDLKSLISYCRLSVCFAEIGYITCGPERKNPKATIREQRKVKTENATAEAETAFLRFRKMPKCCIYLRIKNISETVSPGSTFDIPMNEMIMQITVKSRIPKTNLLYGGVVAGKNE